MAKRAAKPRLTGADFDGELVHLAFNLNQCRAGKPRKTDYCYTIAEAKGRGTFGRVRAYVDRALIEAPEFITSKAILKTARRLGQRQVFAWVRGIMRDPDKMTKLGPASAWRPLTVCPFSDETFMIPVGRQAPCRPGVDASLRPGIPLATAKWAYFDLTGTRESWRMHAVVIPYSEAKKNATSGALLRAAELAAIAKRRGGTIFPNPVLLADYGDYCRAVSAAYDRAPLIEDEEVWRWKLLAAHAERFFERIKSDVEVVFVPGHPYATAQEMRDAVAETGTLLISLEDNVHPVFTPEQNLKFRAVHDHVVHIAPGKGGPDFSQRGEIRAYNLHRRLAPPETWPALFTEVAGQACYHSSRGVFPEQKVALLPFDYYNVGAEMA